MSYLALVGGGAGASASNNSQFNPHASGSGGGGGGLGRSQQGQMYSRAANSSSAYFNSHPVLDNVSADYSALRTPGAPPRQPGTFVGVCFECWTALRAAGGSKVMASLLVDVRTHLLCWVTTGDDFDASLSPPSTIHTDVSAIDSGFGRE